MSSKHFVGICLLGTLAAVCLRAVSLEEATALAQKYSQQQIKSQNAAQEIVLQLGYTPLAQQIIVVEIASKRESPVRINLDFCNVPAAYVVQPHRALVRCNNSVAIACLDVNGLETAFLGDNNLSEISINTTFEAQNGLDVQCDCKLLKK